MNTTNLARTARYAAAIGDIMMAKALVGYLDRAQAPAKDLRIAANAYAAALYQTLAKK